MPAQERLFDLIASAHVFDLGRPLRNGMSQSPNHPAFRHCLDRRHGDRIRSDGGSAASDLITLGCHVGTHVDALAHVSQDGRLYSDLDAGKAQSGGRFEALGIHELPPFLGRGVLLDIPSLLEVDCCPAGYEISVADLQAAASKQGTPLSEGCAALIRTGWGTHFAEPERFVGIRTGVPGVGEDGARWLVSQGVRLVGSDTLAFEVLPPGSGHSLLPVHRVLLVESGVNIIETLDLEGVSGSGVHEFVFVLAHLNVFGATGAPARPLAIALEERSGEERSGEERPAEERSTEERPANS